jgi:hypothetical protein
MRTYTPWFLVIVSAFGLMVTSFILLTALLQETH